MGALQLHDARPACRRGRLTSNQAPPSRTLRLVCRSSQLVYEPNVAGTTRFTTSSSPAQALMEQPTPELEVPSISSQHFSMQEELQSSSQGSWLESIPQANAFCSSAAQLQRRVSQQCSHGMQVVLQAPQHAAYRLSQIAFSPFGALGLAGILVVVFFRLKKLWSLQHQHDDLYTDIDDQLVAYNAKRLNKYKQDIMGVLTGSNQDIKPSTDAPEASSNDSLVSYDQESSSSLAMGVVTDKSVRNEWQRFLASSKATQVREVWDVSMLEELRRQELGKGKLEEISLKLRQRIKETDVQDKPLITLDDLEEETMEQRAARRKARMAAEFASDSDVAVMMGKSSGPRSRATTPHTEPTAATPAPRTSQQRPPVAEQESEVHRVEEAREQLKDRRKL